MKKIFSSLLTIIIIFTMVSCKQQDDGKLLIYASFYPYYYFSSIIGGDKVKVEQITPNSAEVHDFELTTSQRAKMEKASLIVYNGLGIEHWLDSVKSSFGNKGTVFLNASNGLDLIGLNEQHNDHNHSGHDPHIWLSPKNAINIVNSIYKVLAEIDSENESYYKNNLNIAVQNLEKLDEKITQEVALFSKTEIVVSHQAFAYFCRDYGLTMKAIQGISTDIEPTPQQIAEITNYIIEQQITSIFYENTGSSRKFIDTIVQELQAKNYDLKVYTLSSIESLTAQQIIDGLNYISITEINLQSLKEALT